MEKYNLPVEYSKLNQREKREVRGQYVKKQKGLCKHCNHPLDQEPPKNILDTYINWKLFPLGFLNNPVHLHHSHDTDLTVGVEAAENTIEEYKKRLDEVQEKLKQVNDELKKSQENDAIWEVIPQKVKKDLFSKYEKKIKVLNAS